MYKHNLGFIAGHGYSDPGAIGNGYKESERVRYIGKFIVKHFNKITNVKMTMLNGDNDVFQDRNIAEISKEYDQIFEGHLNAIESPTANGTETLVFLDGIDKIDEATLKANSKFWSNRGFKDGSWLYNAVHCSCPYRLIEFCFITNKNDIDTFNKKADEIAKELAKEVASALGEKYVEDTVKTHRYVDVLNDFTNDKHCYVKYRLKITNNWNDGSLVFWDKFENGVLKNKLGYFSKGDILQSLGNYGWTDYGSNGSKNTDRYLIHKVYSSSLKKWGYIAYKKEYK